MLLGRRRLLGLIGAAAAWPLMSPLSAGLAHAEAEGSGTELFRALALQIAQANVIDGNPVPSSAYPGTWLRDAYWTLAALGDSGLQQRTWKRFAAAQNPKTGQIPTAIVSPTGPYQEMDDESTSLFVLLTLALKRAGVALDKGPIERASAFIVNRKVGQDGRALAGPGNYTWWLDTFQLGGRDTVAYTQGVTAVTLRALNELGMKLPAGLTERAEAVYRSLYQPDLQTMTMSAGLQLLDVSCLVGEHLSLRLFNRPLLDDESVANTLNSFSKARFPDGSFLGFRVASQLDGSFIPDEWFSPAPDNWPGHYHNGGSWLLYDAIALHTGTAHGVDGTPDLFRARLAAETRYTTTLHEYIATDPDSYDFGQVPFAWRTGYAWNSYVATLL